MRTLVQLDTRIWIPWMRLAAMSWRAHRLWYADELQRIVSRPRYSPRTCRSFHRPARSCWQRKTDILGCKVPTDSGASTMTAVSRICGTVRMNSWSQSLSSSLAPTRCMKGKGGCFHLFSTVPQTGALWECLMQWTWPKGQGPSCGLTSVSLLRFTDSLSLAKLWKSWAIPSQDFVVSREAYNGPSSITSIATTKEEVLYKVCDDRSLSENG